MIDLFLNSMDYRRTDLLSPPLAIAFSSPTTNWARQTPTTAKVATYHIILLSLSLSLSLCLFMSLYLSHYVSLCVSNWSQQTPITAKVATYHFFSLSLSLSLSLCLLICLFLSLYLTQIGLNKCRLRRPK